MVEDHARRGGGAAAYVVVVVLAALLTLAFTTLASEPFVAGLPVLVMLALWGWFAATHFDRG